MKKKISGKCFIINLDNASYNVKHKLINNKIYAIL